MAFLFIKKNILRFYLQLILVGTHFWGRIGCDHLSQLFMQILKQNFTLGINILRWDGRGGTGSFLDSTGLWPWKFKLEKNTLQSWARVHFFKQKSQNMKCCCLQIYVKCTTIVLSFEQLMFVKEPSHGRLQPRKVC